MTTFPAPESRNVLEAGCARCPSLVCARERIAWGNGPHDATLVVVGEAPAAGNPERERWQGGNHTGMAYTSARSGRKIRDLLAGAGYQGECYFTNAVKCFPADESGESNREPTGEELANCRPHLLAEIEQIRPRAVVTTGKHATRSVLAVDGRSVEGFLETVLDPVESPTLGVPVVPILHPSYQEVWVGRLGYDPAEYERALARTLRAAVDRT